MSLTAERVRSVLRYNPGDGVFYWVKSGKRAGHRSASGYIQIGVDRKLHLAHRLAWLAVHGEWPSSDIDHKNGCPSDNRIENLRLCVPAQNHANSRRGKNNTSGFKGVCFSKAAQKWQAQINYQGRPRYLGLFATPEEASAAYMAAAEQFYGEFARAA